MNKGIQLYSDTGVFKGIQGNSRVNKDIVWYAGVLIQGCTKVFKGIQ